MNPFLVGAAAIALSAAPHAGMAAEPGQAEFNNRCRTCHSVKEGDNRLGPSLHGVVGRKAGSLSGFAAYSQAMKSSGITWDEATLDNFIANPDGVVSGNNMKPFAGIADETERKQIIEYLASLGSAK